MGQTVLVLRSICCLAALVPDVTDVVDMNVQVPVNLFTPAEKDDILFFHACRLTGKSINNFAYFQKLINYYFTRHGGKKASYHTNNPCA